MNVLNLNNMKKIFYVFFGLVVLLLVFYVSYSTVKNKNTYTFRVAMEPSLEEGYIVSTMLQENITIDEYLRRNGFPKDIKKEECQKKTDDEDRTRYYYSTCEFTITIPETINTEQDRIDYLGNLVAKNFILESDQEDKWIIKLDKKEKTNYGYLLKFSWGWIEGNDEAVYSDFFNILISLDKKMIWWKSSSH